MTKYKNSVKRIYRALIVVWPIIIGMSLAPDTRAATLTQTDQTKTVMAAPRSSEISILRTELKDARTFQEDIISTVYWALGVLGAITLFLVGFGWFSNFKIYERDKDTLARDLRSTLDEKLREIEQTLSSTLEQRASSTDAALKELITALEKSEQKNRDSLNRQLEMQLRQVEQKINNHLHQMEDDVLDLQYEYAKNARAEFVKTGVLRNVLSGSNNMLEIAIKYRYENRIADVLDLVAGDVRNIRRDQQGDRTIDAYLLAQVLKNLNAVKGPHAELASRIAEDVATLKSA